MRLPLLDVCCQSAAALHLKAGCCLQSCTQATLIANRCAVLVSVLDLAAVSVLDSQACSACQQHKLFSKPLYSACADSPHALGRYPMYIESDAWVTNLKQKLACGSILVSNKMEYYEWFTRALQPGLHYVQVDPGDLCNDTAFKAGALSELLSCLCALRAARAAGEQQGAELDRSACSHCCCTLCLPFSVQHEHAHSSGIRACQPPQLTQQSRARRCTR